MAEATVRHLTIAAILALFVAGPIVGVVIDRWRGGRGIAGGAAGGFCAAFPYFGGYALRYVILILIDEVGHDELVGLSILLCFVMTAAITLLGGLLGLVVWALHPPEPVRTSVEGEREP